MNDMDRLREFLMMNGDYSVKIDPWGLYGCIDVEVFCGPISIGSSLGSTFKKRVDQVIAIIESHKGGGGV